LEILLSQLDPATWHGQISQAKRQWQRAIGYNVSMKKSSLPPSVLGQLTPAQFLDQYWHKQPLLIRNAVSSDELARLPERTALFKLAAQDEVESRLVHQTSADGAPWQLDNGPFAQLPPLKQKQWTLLVQGVNLYNEAADALLQRFRFLPDARLDDLMVSFATDGGGVGPHFDSYDVFLLQAHGQRRWRISAQQDLSLLPGLPLKILADFRAEQEFVLEPGDMLYLPPHYAHDGVAIGQSITCSIGFRAPSYQELGEAFLQFMADSIDLPGRYADPDLQPSKHPAEISRAMLGTIADELNKVQFDADDILVFLGQYLSEPKGHVFFDAPKKIASPAQFARSAAQRGVRLSAKTRMLYHQTSLFINGESFELSRADQTTLRALANQRALTGAQVAGASTDAAEALYTWYQDGWLLLGHEVVTELATEATTEAATKEVTGAAARTSTRAAKHKKPTPT
jgi:50S ribosomal protein L16 3-hydroxylase